MQESGMWLDIVIQIACGIFGGLLVYAPLARKVWTLQCDLSSAQEQILRDRNQRSAMKRHDVKAELEELKNLVQPVRPVPPANPLAKFGVNR